MIYFCVPDKKKNVYERYFYILGIPYDGKLRHQNCLTLAKQKTDSHKNEQVYSILFLSLV